MQHLIGTSPNTRTTWLPLAALCLALLTPATSRAQAFVDTSDSAAISSSLPEAPLPQTAPAPDNNPPKRGIGKLLPSFQSYDASQTLPPQSVQDKFVMATKDTFGYSAIIVPVFSAAFSYGIDSTPEFGSGGVGYARYLWHAVVNRAVENEMVEFVVPALTHEDTRYYRLGHGGVVKRTGYSIGRSFFTRSDSGKPTFNYAEIVGAGAAAGISTTYYPSRERSFNSVGTSWGINVGADTVTFILQEFWPDISHSLFHTRRPN